VRVDSIESSHEGSCLGDKCSGLVSLGRISNADWVGVPRNYGGLYCMQECFFVLGTTWFAESFMIGG
jgi:hypothetical protein